jgi:hypothetical protein
LPTSGLGYGSGQANNCWLAIVYLWRDMSFPGRADVLMLLRMPANTVTIICDRRCRDGLARRQSRAFVRDADGDLRSGAFDKALDAAAGTAEAMWQPWSPPE